MSNPAAVAQAQAKIARSGNMFMGQSFRAIADALKSVAGPSFQDTNFVAHVGNIQANRIGQTNEAGDSVNDILRVMTAGVWNDVSFQIAAPSDRYRVILGMKFTLYFLETGTDNVGASPVPESVTQQLIALGLLRLDRSRGRMVTSRLWQFMTGADNSRFQTQALAAGVQAEAVAIAQPRIPSENEILPQGVSTSLWTAIDAINPKDRLNATLSGLAGVAAAGGFNQDIGVAVDAIVFDAVMSGQ